MTTSELMHYSDEMLSHNPEGGQGMLARRATYPLTVLGAGVVGDEQGFHSSLDDSAGS